jgi:uncharacterized protein YecT (DUF1311 family)
MTRKLLVAGSLALLLGGCNKPAPIDCSSADAQSVVSSLVADQISKATKTQLGSDPTASQTTESKIRATVAQIKIGIEDVRTTKVDPNSTKRFCEGTLKVVMPLNMLSDADRTRQLVSMGPVSKVVEGAGFERAADSFTHQLSFTVQPTDDHKKTFAEIEDFGSIFDALGEVVASHLLLPTIQAKQQSAVAETQAQQDQLAQQTAAQNQADLDMATAENKLANQAIGEVWKALPADTRAQALDLQRAWIAKKTADCNIRSAETSTDPAIKEAARLRCDTEMTQARSTQLRGLLPS